MRNIIHCGRYDEFVALGTSGKIEAVDLLMKTLVTQDDLATSKLVDFALGLVNSGEGIARLRHYLYNGCQMQRNYAALYFRRKGDDALLEDALAQGKIDWKQAFSK
jgi:hypothetical protein